MRLWLIVMLFRLAAWANGQAVRLVAVRRRATSRPAPAYETWLRETRAGWEAMTPSRVEAAVDRVLADAAGGHYTLTWGD